MSCQFLGVGGAGGEGFKRGSIGAPQRTDQLTDQLGLYGKRHGGRGGAPSHSLPSADGNPTTDQTPNMI